MKSLIIYFFLQGVVYLLEMGMFLLLTMSVKFDVALANLSSKAFAAAISFLGHRYVTFKGADKNQILAQVMKYILAVITNSMLGTTLLLVFEYYFSAHISILKFCSDVLIMILSFYVTKKIIFKV
ncbi:TPA: GtrA family protein [Vibrio cholerae]|uniref:GtrA family protein n=1 Tax=Vibrio cholerae TaxID=666 RepID=UPI0001D5AABB|nr:GtrA family protein [Vibrio cholerae]EFH72948.1 predicted protein [Vibrio cholerae RC385]EGR2040816.1 GtrA family protein [Vibrio cholerae]EGR2064660.1 GtrA family protein [Vibrio cholerae]EGR2115851.1 GtrA family protein [Vibrio cholerae]EGR2127483.1 GtrA family protein [Vibrio cholerae]